MDNPTNNIPEQDTSTPQNSIPAEQSIHLPIQKPKRSKGKIIAIVIAVMVVLAGIAGAVYYFVTSNEADETASQTQQTTPQPSATPVASVADAESTVDAVEGVLKSSSVKIAEKQGKGYWEAADGTVVASIASYSSKDYDFVTYPAKGYSTAVSTADTDKSAIDADYDAAVTFLESKKFSSKDAGPAYDGGKTGLYASEDVVCSLKVSYELRGSHYFGVACADMEEYELAYEAAKPFYDVYKVTPDAMKPTDEVTLTLSQPEYKDGVDGYKNAQVNISTMAGFAGLFYQEPGKQWMYFMGVQDAPMCSKFNTTTLKKAFNGLGCYGNDRKLTTVKAS